MHPVLPLAIGTSMLVLLAASPAAKAAAATRSHDADPPQPVRPGDHTFVRQRDFATSTSWSSAMPQPSMKPMSSCDFLDEASA